MPQRRVERTLVARGWRAAWLGALVAQLVVAGCPHRTESALDGAREGRAPADADVIAAMDADPANATLLALEHGFGLLRQAALPEAQVRRAAGFLERAHQSFEDLVDPSNAELAFAADEDKPYRGRPHERALSAVMLAVTDMAQGRCDMALPTLRSAEFLDARWQPFPFGTDAPLIYALMLRCTHLTGAPAADRERARAGLELALRLKLGLEPALALLYRAQLALPRGDAIPTLLGSVLLERALPAVLINDRQATTVDALVTAAASEAHRYLDTIDAELANPAVAAIVERVARLAPAAADPVRIRRQAETLLEPECQRLQQAMRALAAGLDGGTLDAAHPAAALRRAIDEARQLAAAIEATVTRPRLALRFAGRGPRVEREGEYNEIAVIRPAEDGTARAEVRRLGAVAPAPGCGFHRAADGALEVVLCDGEVAAANNPEPALEAVELWSSSYQATSVVGRRFDRVLAGRALFKTGAQDVSQVAAWTSWFLFQVALEIIGSCSGDGEGAVVCLTIGLVVLAVAVLGAGVAGVVWLAGVAVNAAADGRYVHNLFESGQILMAGEAR